MRIIALPLTRPGRRSTKAVLTYYQFQVHHPKDSANADGKAPSSSVGRYVKLAQQKAADIWAGFGKAKEGNWKLKTYRYGERLVDKLDFEELALKGIDPSLGPSIALPPTAGSDVTTETPSVAPISLLHPPSIDSSPSASTPETYSPLDRMRDLLAYRKPRHRKGFYTWMIIAPFTAPFMIVPIIPNLPFFFCVWRSWSHWRAYRASQYLETLVDMGAIVPEASSELDRIYAQYKPEAGPPESSDPKNPSSDGSEAERTSVLLTRDAVPEILSLFELPPAAEADIYRAVEQARIRVEEGKA
ncbi:hypothetical protein PLICRDRAFT_106278 [Plicaturopsis crispa FD-325 SS-3]|nr:hypothetical protein PLICRDRAFT_106278 [Plicaturopsis crispa FD-325 SS-3]